jgi:hypothetical protein
MKAIETRYKNRRFRSRLEARWAVFFDALGIQWEYEKEGYELDGMQYLPDFWLPEQDCWVEIKGQEPTEEEEEKARRLSYCTGKTVCIRFGDICPDNNGCSIFPGVQIHAFQADQPEKRISITPLEVPYQLARAIALLEYHDINITYVGSNLGSDTASLYIKTDFLAHFDKVPSEISRLTSALTSEEVIESMSILSQSVDVLHQLSLKHNVLNFYLGTRYNREDFLGTVVGGRHIRWSACKQCGSVGIVEGSIKHKEEKCPHSVTQQIGRYGYQHDDERIDAAYAAAMQARFEFGETPN